ncbi:uncharacterized protein LOC6727786 [Drosophila simulans]|uniref:GD20272 n=1 Tax=Drosophila simulans TaxID=7240 RepID=B4QWF9_DROSI|nr:uncharacterized protein LOC6727786 [Drosophila simulans]EDX12650.1 GD20272 [Drosophila simulans]KMZ03112.1 uncharacterized protein Dsimw501_GD20272 [Drosophila simulans]
MSEYYCGYNPPPPNFKTFFPEKYKDRLQRLPNFGKLRSSWEIHRRPTVVVLHVFADDIGALEKWIDMVYRLAAPGLLGGEMDFFVDDVWQSFIFNEDDFSFSRSDEGCTVDSFPLIYAANSTGKVFFFGDFTGPKLPDLESLRDFCDQVIKGIAEEPTARDPTVENLSLDSWNELMYACDNDIALCFYNSLQNGAEVNRSLMANLDWLADKLKQESVLLYKMDINGASIPKKFLVESPPAFFFLKGNQKHNPLRCKYKLDMWTMLRFIAENSSEELCYYNRRGNRRLHADLLIHIRDYFNLSRNKTRY